LRHNLEVSLHNSFVVSQYSVARKKLLLAYQTCAAPQLFARALSC